MNELSILNTLFNGDDFGFPSFRATTNFVPKVDVRETKNAYILDMDLPGLSENDVTIELDDNVLSICSKEKNQGEEKSEEKKTPEDFQWLIRERRNSAFTRRFSLPRDIDSESIKATFANGVLTVTIPRKEECGAKKISISVA